MKWIAFSLLGLFAAFLALCSPIVPSNATEPDVVRNSVFTQELADQCADTAHYDCQLVKSAPEGCITIVEQNMTACPVQSGTPPTAPEPQGKFNCTGCMRR